MNTMLNKIFLFLLAAVLLSPCLSIAQPPVCSTSGPVYLSNWYTANGIFNYNPALPMSATNPSQNSITVPFACVGLAAGPNLNAPTPSTTFYTIENGNYLYYNGSSWVNTGHSSGSGNAINPASGSRYIFNVDILTGNIYRYDGTGNSVVITNINMLGSVFDLAADCMDNFYVLRNIPPRQLKKYNSNGAFLNAWDLVGGATIGIGAGLAIMGNNIYYSDTAYWHGVITGNIVNVTAINYPFGSSAFLPNDFASCPGLLVVSFTDNITVCPDQLPYHWQGHDYSTAGIYTVSYNSVNGCDSVITLNLAVAQVPAPSVISTINYCQHTNAVQLTATGTGILHWYTSASGGAGSLSAPIPSTASAGITNYHVSQEISNCEGPRAVIAVEVYSAPSLGPDKEIRVCDTYTAVNLPGLYNVTGYNYSWTINGTVVPDPSAVFTEGSYQLVAIAANGCADTSIASLILQPPVHAFAGNDSIVEYNMPFHLSGSGGSEYLWSPDFALDNPQLSNPLAVLTEHSSFYLQVKDIAGCTGFDTVNFKVYAGPAIYVPNSFTPNGDHVNDLFTLTAAGISRLDYIKIFDRYGKLVFQSNDILKSWDGTYKGKPQPAGNYVWILQALNRYDRVVQMQGSVMLFR